jgi:hypothetical protein
VELDAEDKLPVPEEYRDRGKEEKRLATAAVATKRYRSIGVFTDVYPPDISAASIYVLCTYPGISVASISVYGYIRGLNIRIRIYPHQCPYPDKYAASITVYGYIRGLNIRIRIYPLPQYPYPDISGSISVPGYIRCLNIRIRPYPRISGYP